MAKKIPESDPKKNALPETGFLRQKQILGDPDRNIPPLIPVCRSTWENGVKSGRYPPPYKIGVKANGWKVEDIRKVMTEMGQYPVQHAPSSCSDQQSV